MRAVKKALGEMTRHLTGQERRNGAAAAAAGTVSGTTRSARSRVDLPPRTIPLRKLEPVAMGRPERANARVQPMSGKGPGADPDTVSSTSDTNTVHGPAPAQSSPIAVHGLPVPPDPGAGAVGVVRQPRHGAPEARSVAAVG